MPAQYDLPEYQGASDIQDINQYQKLPFYLAFNEAKYFPQWQTWDKLFGKLNWTPNMGTTLRGVRAEPTPVGAQTFYPNSLQVLPNKDIYENLETYEEATLSWHDFDSKQFYFLPSYQDFRENQIDYTHKDIVRQIAIRNDMFIRSYVLQKTPYIFNAGDQNLVGAPYIPSGTAITAANVALAGKNTAFWQAQINTINTAGARGLTLAILDQAAMVLRDEIGAPYFENAANTVKDNSLIKGKYVLIGSMEAFQMFKWDQQFSRFRPSDLNVLEDGFMGSIFNEITYKSERWPLRIAADGTLPAPEVYDVANNRTVPNPAYTAAPYEVAFLCGADAFKTLKVGPPPKPFSSGKMDAAKFYSMAWNGEVRLTDQIIVNYNDGAGNIVQDLNYRGRLLKLYSSVVYGGIPVQQRNVLPIVYARVRPKDVANLPVPVTITA